ncbi:hypothetical protein PF005_g7690 [Phytophthora fragariae]|uniref:Uncharacterized protein n=1 Tax=Phytophthora fragariae TaxID=53985 RepID=A0A6A4DHZ5_9STRA|nr:hypothetical protein PF003_g36383 [Phytophthora fragariae]KAE8941668.1 hypothetical protein PF009_g8547 [Phytophthora fragariae]KAE9005106.1 hypothetical protein PF011_g12181 [Phytophthora fragariae]KAE9106800.1 hypothetical protein PF010_g12499 [Phytophthora fragariae]KAE9108888.1 hypothetical protein PF007_g12478 [Phytophthora fragariae]
MRQNESMDNLEANMEGVPPQDKSKKRQQEQTEEEDKPKCRRTSVAYLHATSFTWYAQDPRWVADAPKRQRSNAKQLVALTKLFVAGDLKLKVSILLFSFGGLRYAVRVPETISANASRALKKLYHTGCMCAYISRACA